MCLRMRLTASHRDLVCCIFCLCSGGDDVQSKTSAGMLLVFERDGFGTGTGVEESEGSEEYWVALVFVEDGSNSGLFSV